MPPTEDQYLSRWSRQAAMRSQLTMSDKTRTIKAFLDKKNPSAAPAVVYVVDDDQAVRRSLRFLLEAAGWDVRCYDNGQAFLDAFDPAGPPCCLLLDVRMPGLSGLQVQQEMRAKGLDAPTIIITGHGDVPVAVRAMQAGAMDFVEKPVNDNQALLKNIERAIARDRKQRHNLARIASTRRRMDKLTPREHEVLDLVVRGRLNKQMADQLNIAEKTIEMHRKNMMDKMQVASVADLVRDVLAATERDHEDQSDAA